MCVRAVVASPAVCPAVSGVVGPTSGVVGWNRPGEGAGKRPSANAALTMAPPGESRRRLQWWRGRCAHSVRGCGCKRCAPFLERSFSVNYGLAVVAQLHVRQFPCLPSVRLPFQHGNLDRRSHAAGVGVDGVLQGPNRAKDAWGTDAVGTLDGPLAGCPARCIFDRNSEAMNPEARSRAGRLCLGGSESRNRLGGTSTRPVFFLSSRSAGGAVGVGEAGPDGGAPATVKAGDVLFVPAGAIHSVKNVGAGNGAELATYALKKTNR